MSFTPELVLAVPLLSVLGAAAWHDARSFRIPNVVTGTGVLVGLALNSFLPDALGFVSAALGLGAALLGLLPLYFLRIWGAGDVKLMAVVGAFLGPAAFVQSLMFSLVAGGITAVVVACQRRTGGLLAQNIKYMTYDLLFSAQTRSLKAVEAPAQSAGKVPYAVPILLGTAAYLLHTELA